MLVPIVTVVGLYLGVLIGNSVLTEIVFNRPGIGKLIVDAAEIRNFPVVRGGVFATVALFAVAMPLADLVVAWLDPRVRNTL